MNDLFNRPRNTTQELERVHGRVVKCWRIDDRRRGYAAFQYEDGAVIERAVPPCFRPRKELAR